MAKAADWSALADVLLVEISQRIVLYMDFAAFRGICTSWRSAVAKENFKLRMPLLFLPPKKSSDLRDFVIPPQGMTRRILLPEANAKMCFSSKGWIITIAPNLSMNLLHSFSHTQIELPHIKSIRYWHYVITPKMYARFIYKAILSSNPLLTLDYTVMVIYGRMGDLAYSKPGDKAWTKINSKGLNLDLTYYKGKLYAINIYGRIMACDFRGDNPTVAQVANMPHNISHPTIAQVAANVPSNISHLDKVFIVESLGRLLVVIRDGPTEFRVYEVDLSTNNWIRIKDLGNTTLFLGHSSSMSIESDGVCIKPNRIYFINDCIEACWYSGYRTKREGGKDIRIYNIEDGSTEPYFLSDYRNLLIPPMWVEQS